MTDLVRDISNDYMTEIRKKLTQLYKKEIKNLILNEDIGVLRETIERMTEVWRKFVTRHELFNEAAALADIGFSCFILDAIIEYKRYKLGPEKILRFREKQDLTDIDAAFRYFVELMKETLGEMTVLYDLEDARKELGKTLELWKKERLPVENIKKEYPYTTEESLEAETLLLSDIANRCMILYSIFTK
jgi:hypothetical protein